MKIVTLDGYVLNPGDLSWDEIAALGELAVHDRSSPSDVIDRSRDAEIILTNKAIVSRDVINAAKHLRFISVLATGFNVVDVAAARERAIPVSNVPEYGTNSVAEFVFSLLFALCRRPERHSHSVTELKRWTTASDWSFTETPQVELAGLTFGIIGFGHIGRRVGAIANAFGMKVLANSTTRSQKADYPFEWRSVEEIFSESDVVSLHCPLTALNKEIVNRNLLSRMKPTAFLINTARGGLINEQDLADALAAGTFAGAAADVISHEPMRPDNPLLTAQNIILTPHIAWATRAARERLMKQTAENIRAFLNGAPINVVN